MQGYIGVLYWYLSTVLFNIEHQTLKCTNASWTCGPGNLLGKTVAITAAIHLASDIRGLCMDLSADRLPVEWLFIARL